MPGQRKRKRRQREERRRAAERLVPEAGHWEPVFETQDESELRSHLRHLEALGRPIDGSTVRVDMFCGRLRHPTTYRLSVFVPACRPE
ncbi:hypothetical protein [Streptomyces sp. NPDC001537]